MEKITCKQCGKVIEGYTKRHVETIMAQHQFKHDNERRNAATTKPTSN